MGGGTNPAARRSQVARFMTQEVKKLINLPALKDHQSAGVTLALKNLSHGLVNNVSRKPPTLRHQVRSGGFCGQQFTSAGKKRKSCHHAEF